CRSSAAPPSSVLAFSLHDALPIFGVLGRQQSHTQSRFADAPAGIDPWTKRKAQVAAGRLAVETTRVDQRGHADVLPAGHDLEALDRKSTRLNSSHVKSSYAVFCLK